VDLARIGQLTFLLPDFQRFPCLKLAYDALLAGGSAPAILNAANEVAVQAFLDRKIGFRAIDRVIARVMQAVPHGDVADIDSLLEQDRLARATAQSFIQ
jgi:1-deoxy-D-xylulose-5-phosphate reductoisomerase